MKPCSERKNRTACPVVQQQTTNQKRDQKNTLIVRFVVQNVCSELIGCYGQGHGQGMIV